MGNRYETWRSEEYKGVTIKVKPRRSINERGVFVLIWPYREEEIASQFWQEEFVWGEAREFADGWLVNGVIKMVLNLDMGGTLAVSPNDFTAQRIAVLGISGSGKTNTVAVLVEELLPHLPVTIVDIEGEYYGLKEKYNLLIAGRSERAEVPLLLENAAALAEISIRRGISIILDLSEYDPEEMKDILLAYFEHLWKLCTSLKTPYYIVVEEAHEFVSQGAGTPLKKTLTRFALRGRKQGVGIILASQRSAKVDKDLLTQANILFLHNVVHPVDLGVYKDLVPLPAKEVEQRVRELEPGSAFVVWGKRIETLSIRRRHTFHAGVTPALGQVTPSLKTIEADLIEELRQITARSVKEGGSDEVSKLKKQLKDASTEIDRLREVIKQQADRIALLSQLEIVMPTTMEIEHAAVSTVTVHQADTGFSQPMVVEALSSKQISPPFNEAKFNSLQTRFRKLPPHELDILRVLNYHAGRFTASQIATWLNKSESSVQNNPPRSLMNMALVKRERNSSKRYVYWTILVEYLQKEFPGADAQVLAQRLVK